MPVIDTLRLIFTRLRQGRSPLSPGRTHLHHFLLDKGLSPRLTLISMLVIADILFWIGYFLKNVSGLLSAVGLMTVSLSVMVFSSGVYCEIDHRTKMS